MTERVHPLGVTVVIPTFNRTNLLIRAVESVTSTRPALVEIIVVDDASATDPRLLLPHANLAGVPLRVFRFERNRGPQAARNLGIRRARFSHIAFLDSDDAFAEGKIDAVLSELEAHPQPPDIVFHAVGGMAKINRLGRVWHRHLQAVLPFHWWAVLYNPVVTPSLVIKRRIRLGRAAMRHCEDWCFLLRYTSPGMKVTYLDAELSQVFRPQGSEGGLSSSVWRMRRGEFQARGVLLRHNRVEGAARYVLGSIVGVLRISNDLLRGRYWR